MAHEGLLELKKQFLEYLEVEKGRSAKTVENYDHYLERFFGWLASNAEGMPRSVRSLRGKADKKGRFALVSKNGMPKKSGDFFGEKLEGQTPRGVSRETPPVHGRAGCVPALSDITEDNVRGFRVWLNRKNLSKQTQNYHVIALRVFLKFLAHKGIDALAPERLELAKTGQREVSFLETDELERLFSAVEGTSARASRDRAILATLFSTGVRVSELCCLDIDSINIDKGEFAVRGKGDKIRLVFLSRRAKDSLRDYIDKRSNIAEKALFVRMPRGKVARTGANFTRLTPRSIQRLIKYYATRAGIVGKKVSPHTMRHSFSTDLLRNGADLRSVQELLGHASITTTQIYTHVTNPQLKKVHEKFHKDPEQ